MIRTIETHPQGVIQKLTTPKGAVSYQAGTPGEASTMTPHRTLAAARTALGVIIVPPERLTVPKAECQHNRPGYKASNTPSSGKGKPK